MGLQVFSFGKNARLLSLVVRNITTTSTTRNNLTTLEVDDKTGIATLSINRPPVNGLNLELLRDIRESIDQAENNKFRGLILTSTSKTIFSAGLDILEMYKPDQERLRNVWTTLQDTWLALYGCSIPTAAAVNGHSPAGGCLLAISCEYRVMLPNFTIGLNETQLGVIAPKWCMNSYINVLPKRKAELALTQGKLFTTDEALREGLVDEVATTKEEAILKCEQFIRTFAKVNPFARAMTKHQLRSRDLQQLEDERENDLEAFLFSVNQPSVQEGLGQYLEKLKSKTKK